MANARPTASPNGGHRSRCLLLIPRGLDAPLNLIDGLRRRKVLVRQVADPYAVMVALADPDPQRPKVVVVVEPGLQTYANALIEAMRCYHDDVAIWQYDPTQRPALSPWPAPPAPGSETPAPDSETTDLAGDRGERVDDWQTHEDDDLSSATDKAIDRHVDDSRARDAGEETVPSEDDDPMGQPLISEEELAMLLGSEESDTPMEK